MSLNPLWEEVTPQCASFKWKGTLSQCYSSPTVWVALGTAVVDLLCVARSYRLPYRKDQEVYTGRWKGQLLWRFGRDPNSSVIRRDSEWPTERERLGYVCNPRSLKEGTETSRPVATVAVPPLGGRVSGSAPQRKNMINAVHRLPLILTLWSAAAGCNDRMPMSIGSFSYTRSG